ncbi:ku70-like protein [Obba rivulosa]|uniref:ATP-dependent DNA helicase II subunit 1 n=1 Tax=Obba rivulosa TaxID=1052685 RepID=A0A8E2AWT9_9APHY|nr:ku70-like protein [Obba rivulosa]
MTSYEDWNKLDDDEDVELEYLDYLEGNKDVILFCIDCSPSMHKLYEDPRYEDVQTSHLFTAFEAAMQIQKKKVIVGPNDLVGILLFNTSRQCEPTTGQGAEIKKGTYVYQPIATVDAPKVQELMRLLDAARENPGLLSQKFPPLTEGRVPMGDVFTSCNWVMRDGAPKTAVKRVFLITDEDDPHPGPARERLLTSAKTTLVDLLQAGVTVEPFFISTEDKPFEPNKFYSAVLLPISITDDDGSDGTVLPESISITRVEELLSQMRFHEVPKRALFSVRLELAKDFTIGVKGYGLVTKRERGKYEYFYDLGDRMVPAKSRTIKVDDASHTYAGKSEILFGMTLGGAPADEDKEDAEEILGVARVVPANKRPFYTRDEINSFKTMGLEPMLKLLGFKDTDELAYEDNVNHSIFIYPDEMTYSGSRRTFTALLRTMLKKGKIGIALGLMRRNMSPMFYAMLPQEENTDENGWEEPAGIHLIPLPFADDIRTAPVETAHRASSKLQMMARAWIDKISVRRGGYPPDSYPNPTLAYHNAQLEAAAFREEFDEGSFEDLTKPKHDMIHERAGQLMQAWKGTLLGDETANTVPTKAGSKRKADVTVDEAEIRSKHEVGMLDKLRVDQLKDFCKSKSLPVSGKKADLVERVGEWLDTHA